MNCPIDENKLKVHRQWKTWR